MVVALRLKAQYNHNLPCMRACAVKVGPHLTLITSFPSSPPRSVPSLRLGHVLMPPCT